MPRWLITLLMLFSIVLGRRRDHVNRVREPFMNLVGLHHRTGTTLVKEVLKDVFKDFEHNDILGELEIGGMNLWNSIKKLGHGSYHNVSKQGCSTYFFYHWKMTDELYMLDSPYKVIHIVRDPADVIVSAYKYHLLGHEAYLHKRGIYEKLVNNSVAVGLAFQASDSFIEIERMLREAQRLRTVSRERNMQVYYGDFERNYNGTWRKIFNFMHLPVEANIDRMIELAAKHNMMNTPDQSHLSEKETRHITRIGGKEHTELKAILDQDPEWGPKIRKMRYALNYYA